MNLRRPPPDLGQRVFRELCGLSLCEEVAHRNGEAKVSPSPRSPKNRATATNTAKLMGISRMAVIKIAKAYFSGGEKAVQALRWGKGKPLQNCFLTQLEIRTALEAQKAQVETLTYV